jgi:hypothetical protein
VWAVLQGFFVFARTVEVGAIVNITRRVALASNEAGPSPTNLAFCFLGLICGTVPVTALSLVVAVPAYVFVEATAAGEVPRRDVLLLTLLCLIFAVLMSAAGAVLAVVEGRRRIVTKNAIVIGSNVLSVACAIPLMSAFGAPGLGLTYVMAAAGQLIGGCVAVAVVPEGEHIGSLGPLVRDAAKESLQLLGVTLARYGCEPITKLLLALVAPLGFVAVVDLAMKVTLQLRIVVQALAQPLLAYGAHRGELTDQSRPYFVKVHQLVGALAPLTLVGVVVTTPVLSFVALGQVDVDFVLVTSLLAAANLVHALSLSGYFLMASGGRFAALFAAFAPATLANLVLGAMAVLVDQPYLVVAAYAVSYALSGWLIGRTWERSVPQGGATWVRAAVALCVRCVAATTMMVLLLSSRGTSVLLAAASVGLLVAVLLALDLRRALATTSRAA